MPSRSDLMIDRIIESDAELKRTMLHHFDKGVALKTACLLIFTNKDVLWTHAK